jgi:DNA (cytosine-5)-methyltransferase 1
VKLGSLFSGIGGLDLGVEAATGARTVWQVERDEWCRGILARHWPDAVRYDDVCKVGEELERVDIIAGGFPCQDVSVAGKRAGLTGGERSGLWREYARIVRVVRPRFVFVENVAGLLSMEFGRVLGDLAALGFDAEWAVFRASDAGAPHRRERVFVLAVADAARVDDERSEREGDRSRRPARAAGNGRRIVADAERIEGIERHDADLLRRRSGDAQQARVGGSLGDAASARREGIARAGGAGEGVADTDLSRLEGRRVPERGRGKQRARGARCSGGDGSGRAQPRLGGVADGLFRGLDDHRWPAGRGAAQHEWEAPRVAQGVPERRQRLKALGNAVVPQQAALAWRVLSERLAQHVVASVMEGVACAVVKIRAGGAS